MVSREGVTERLRRAGAVWLFLDYDGTLADFAPTPDEVAPDPELVDLVAGLARDPRLRVAIISGRRLRHVRRLVPVPGILLAGTYGVELQMPDGQQRARVAYEAIRPTLDTLKPRWAGLIASREGFYLEDKDWALALHARFAAEEEAERVLAAARQQAMDVLGDDPAERFRLLGGHKFLEVGPRLAHKGRTIGYLLDRYAEPGTLPVYLGDDDKDEEAFGVIKERGGIPILVAPGPRETVADLRLESPQAARRWVVALLARPGGTAPLEG
jgi:trehalose 6-phosphate phosphatase